MAADSCGSMHSTTGQEARVLDTKQVVYPGSLIYLGFLCLVEGHLGFIGKICYLNSLLGLGHILSSFSPLFSSLPLSTSPSLFPPLLPLLSGCLLPSFLNSLLQLPHVFIDH